MVWLCGPRGACGACGACAACCCVVVVVWVCICSAVGCTDARMRIGPSVMLCCRYVVVCVSVVVLTSVCACDVLCVLLLVLGC